MRQPFFEDLMTAMYPSGLLHTFGVNGKISGSVGAVGEMQEVLPLLHSPRGCGFHYRYSARRRHQPFYSVLTSNLEERDIICGGEEKLRQAIRDAWSRYRPGLIMVIPSPISDILNEDVRSVCAELRREGISVVGVQSELFSHRDKNYTRNRLKELARQTITGDNRLEMELKGCGFTEALYALVEQVMEPSAQIPHSVNIETVGWGSEGKAALRELEVFLNGCGIQVNTWIPSAPLSSLVHAPAAELNLVKRVRWARRMREKFGTAYLHIGGAGRYAGLDGICTFYRDIGQALRMEAAVEPVVLAARAQALEETAEARRRLGQARAVLVSRSIQQAPFELKSYVRDYGLSVSHLCVILTPESRKNLNVTPALEDSLLARVREAAALYSPETQLLLNPAEETLRGIFTEADVVVGTGDFTLEGMGAPLIPAVNETTSLSFPSYVRTVRRMCRRLEHGTERSSLLLGKCPSKAAITHCTVISLIWPPRKCGPECGSIERGIPYEAGQRLQALWSLSGFGWNSGRRCSAPLRGGLQFWLHVPPRCPGYAGYPADLHRHQRQRRGVQRRGLPGAGRPLRAGALPTVRPVCGQRLCE